MWVPQHESSLHTYAGFFGFLQVTITSVTILTTINAIIKTHFFPRSVKFWNNLPPELKTCNQSVTLNIQ